MSLSDREEVARTLGRLADDASSVADKAGLLDLAQRFRAVSGADRAAVPRVVVAGETKRGKSSLVNALVGRPLLSPVGDEVVTATYVLFSPAEQDSAVAIVADPAGGAAQRINVRLDELADYVSVDAVHEGVLGAEVFIDAPLLRGMQLVDTPGVGGLHRGHSSVTMAMLETADALLFVMDAGAPLSLPELRFLAQAGRQTETIVLAMTKTDVYPEWKVIQEDDRTLISQHAPRLADVPIFGVSSRLADKASLLAGDDSDTAIQLRRISGLEALTQAIRERIDTRTRVLSDANKAEVVRGLLRELRSRVAEQPKYLARDPSALAALVAERDRLKMFLHDPHGGLFDIYERLTQVRRTANHDFDLEVAGLTDRCSGQIESCPQGDLKQIPTLLEGELVQVAAHHLSEVGDQLADIVDSLERRVGSTVVLDNLRTKVSEALNPRITSHVESKDQAEPTVTAAGEMAMSSAMLFAGGWLAAGPVGIAIGVAAVATYGLKRFYDDKTAARRQSLRLWLDRAGREIRRSFDGASGSRIEAVERVIEVELPRLLEERVARIDELGKMRTTAVPSTEAADEEVDKLIGQTERLIVELRAS